MLFVIVEEGVEFSVKFGRLLGLVDIGRALLVISGVEIGVGLRLRFGRFLLLLELRSVWLGLVRLGRLVVAIVGVEGEVTVERVVMTPRCDVSGAAPSHKGRGDLGGAATKPFFESSVGAAVSKSPPVTLSDLVSPDPSNPVSPNTLSDPPSNSVSPCSSPPNTLSNISDPVIPDPPCSVSEASKSIPDPLRSVSKSLSTPDSPNTPDSPDSSDPRRSIPELKSIPTPDSLLSPLSPLSPLSLLSPSPLSDARSLAAPNPSHSRLVASCCSNSSSWRMKLRLGEMRRRFALRKS